MIEDPNKKIPIEGDETAPSSRGPVRWWLGALPVAPAVGAVLEGFRPGHPWLHGGLGFGLAAAMAGWGWFRERRHTLRAGARVASLEHQLEEARRRADAMESKARLLEESPVATILVDANGAVTGCNAAFASLTGFSAEEVRGRNLPAFLHGPGSDPSEAGRLREAIRSGGFYRGELLHYTRSGRAFWSEVDLRSLHGDDGRLLGFVATWVEVTHRRRLERDLELGRQRLAGLMATVPGAVFELFHGEDGTLGFTFVSEGLRELSGLEPEALLRDPGLFLESIHPDDRSLLEPELRTAEEKGAPWRQVLRIIHLGGGIRSVAVRAVSKSIEGGGHRWTGLFSDVTPETERESELLQRQRDLNRLESLARLGSWQRRLGSGKTDWSDTLFGILGLDREGITPGFESFLERVHPEDRERFHGAVAEAEVHGTPFELRLRVVRPDGQVRWVCSRGVLEKPTPQEPALMRGTLQDVHEAVLHEQELAAAQARFRLALEGTGDAFWEWNPIGGELVHSVRWAEMLECAEGELPSNWEAWISRVHPEDRPALESAVEDLRSGFSGCLSVEYRIAAKDGRWVWMHDRGMAVERDGRGQVVRVAGTHADVTHRKESDDRLGRTEARLEEVQRLGRIGSWRTSGSDTVELSAVAEELFRSEDGTTWPWAARLAWMEPLERGRVAALVDGLDDGEGYVVEYRLGGSPSGAWVRETGRRIPDASEAGFHLEGWLQDVGGIHAATDVRRELGVRLCQAQRMEMVGTLAGGIAHEFNNLLTGIQGFVELARTGVAADSEPGAYLKHASEGADSARELVRRLLGFSRVRRTSAPEMLDLVQILRQTAPLLTASLPAHVTLVLQLPTGSPRVRGDAVSLQQAVVNLCLHSADRLGDTAGEVTLGLDSTGSQVRIRISDTAGSWGPGERERILGGAGHPEATDPRSIALQATREIVQSHGGSIEAGAGEAGSVRLEIRLPAAPEASSEPGAADDPNGVRCREEPGKPVGPLRVAVVDDEPTVRVLLRATLRKSGHEVEMFGDAADLLARLEKAGPSPDLVITDLAMPGMTGAQLLERIRAGGNGIPVVGMSGDAHRFDTTRLESLGGYATLAKPFTSADLATAIAAARDRRDRRAAA